MLRIVGVMLLVVSLGWLWHEWETGKLEKQLATALGDTKTMQVNRDEWKESAEKRLAELGTIREERTAARTALRELENRLNEKDQAYLTLRDSIRNAPETDDGPVAPVLRNALEDLP